jgi:putative DNA primase/helicase
LTEQPKLYCPICKKPTKKLGSPDSIGQQFYKCENGHQTTKEPLTEQGMKVVLAFEIQAEQNGEKHYIDPLNPMAAFCNGKGVFKTALVAQYLNYNYHFKIDRLTEIFYYGDETTKVWKTKAEIYVQEILSKLLGEENTKSHYTNILHDLKGLSYDDVVFSKKVAVENGLLDVETGKLTEPTLEEMAYYSIPVRYDPTAKKTENWLEFLKQVTNPEDVPLLQEWFGFCLLPDYKFHKVLWIHGDGRNGKGVFDRTIQGIIGKNNVSAIGLEELDGSHRFSLCHFYGKLYNTCSEPTTNKIFRTEIFQKLTGSDTIKAELKVANNRIEFVNCAKLTIIGNKFPKIDNPTVAFKDRMMFVKFPNFFSDKDRIANLENVWLNDPEQKSAILNWALEGLHRLNTQNSFTQTKTQKETEIEFNRVSNPPGAFIMEMGILCKTLVTTRAANLTTYQEYCEDIGVLADAKALTQAMNRLSPKVKEGWIYKPKKERAWLGFGLRNIEQQNIEQMEQLEQQKTLNEINQTEKSYNRQEETGVPSVPSVPISNPSEHQLIVEQEPSGLKRLETTKPRFYVKEIPIGPKCDCGKLAVTFEIVTPGHDVLKRCTDCLEKLKQQFPGAIFCAAYPEMPSFDDSEGGA